MKKIISKIRDIQHIEKELHTNPVGVLALNLKDDELVQTATTFLYQDKNIYFFLDDKDEIYDNMKFETDVKESIQRTREIISIRFAKPEEFDYRPGQFIFITVGSEDKEVTKHLSISSSPTEDFLEVTKRLGLEDSGGMVRVGPVHYNMVEEIRRFGEVLEKIKRALIRLHG